MAPTFRNVALRTIRSVLGWLPLPLWCYALPVIGVTLGWLPQAHPAYRMTTDALLPLALGLLLLGTDLPAVLRTGSRALLAMLFGACGMMIGTPLGVWLLRDHLPAEAWKGAGALAGTWTGGTMNLLALRSLLGIPDEAFAPLIVVDAVMAYSWMAVLVWLSGQRDAINRWFRAAERVDDAQPARGSMQVSPPRGWGASMAGLIIIVAVVALSRRIAGRLPAMLLISSVTAWTVFLVTSMCLGLSCLPRLRHMGAAAGRLGALFLYVVLAATGAQANLTALGSSPAWLLVGLITVGVHAVVLVLAGRVWRLPLSLLATASQANIGGVVSAPLVAAVYRRALVPIGLLLAIAGNAVGTYLGWVAALLARSLTP